MNKRASIVTINDKENVKEIFQEFFSEVAVGDFFVNPQGSLFFKISDTHGYTLENGYSISFEGSHLVIVCNVEITYTMKRRVNYGAIEAPERWGKNL